MLGTFMIALLVSTVIHFCDACSVLYTLQMRMPSGRYVTAQVSCWMGECVMNIVAYALGEDRSNSQGLCGNFDNIDWNDLIQAGLPEPRYPREPIEFTTHFL